jgi:hypothetical protein
MRNMSSAILISHLTCSTIDICHFHVYGIPDFQRFPACMHSISQAVPQPTIIRFESDLHFALITDMLPQNIFVLLLAPPYRMPSKWRELGDFLV